VSESEAKLDGVKADAEAAKTSVDEVAAESEGTDIKGIDSASHRIIRMIPGLREAQRLQHSLALVSAGSVMGILGLLMVAYSIYRQISAMLEEQQQQRNDYNKAIMEARGFTTLSQIEQYKESQRKAIENSYRPGIIP
jgi:hypothetical protein